MLLQSKLSLSNTGTIAGGKSAWLNLMTLLVKITVCRLTSLASDSGNYARYVKGNQFIYYALGVNVEVKEAKKLWIKVTYERQKVAKLYKISSY